MRGVQPWKVGRADLAALRCHVDIEGEDGRELRLMLVHDAGLDDVALVDGAWLGVGVGVGVELGLG